MNGKKIFVIGIISMFILLSGCTTKNDYSSLTKQIEADFEDRIKVETVHGVVSSDIESEHTEIKIQAIDEEYRRQLIEANGNIYSNKGSKEDKILIRGIQDKVKEYASQMKNEIDAVSFTYPDEVGNIMQIAYSQKNNDIIPTILLTEDRETYKSNKKTHNKSNKSIYKDLTKKYGNVFDYNKNVTKNKSETIQSTHTEETEIKLGSGVVKENLYVFEDQLYMYNP